MTTPCPCGGETRTDYFDHPKLTEKWFLRCTVCGLMSDLVATEADLETVTIKDNPCVPAS